MDKVIYDVSLFTDYDIYLFKQGNHFRLYEKLGAHLMTVNNIQGAFFGVWAPNAANVSVIGDFNGWNTETHPLRMREDGFRHLGRIYTTY
ncbi:1,4-alpha-glucan branching enzyme GlgB [Candidatus Methanoperedenaceae archaeon GB50]|nr:1,4-alpha-glucan branching enzyme GlgB [Candidatus Methanoperedenaceae archaeon GB50]